MTVGRKTRVIALATLVVATIAGCSGESNRASSNAEDIELVTATDSGTEQVDTVTWGLPAGEPTTVDPFRAGAESESTVVGNFCENTLRLAPDFSVGPGLATSAEFTDDTTFVIDLREGVKFWDGTPMTAEDALWSYQHTADPKAGGVYAGAFRNVTSMKVTGPLQVTLKFAAPDAQFRSALASGAGAIVQKKFAESAGRGYGSPKTGVMCTGPYEFDSWTPGEGITATAYEDYWDGAPLVDTLEFQFIPDSNTLTSALRAGEIDGAYNVPVSAATSLKSSDSGRLLFGPSTASLSFGPTTDEGPAADPQVREALDLAIDKEELIDGVLRGYGEPLKTLTPPFAWGGLPEADIYQAGYDALPSNEQDIERAKQLVEETGVGSTTLRFATVAGEATTSQAATVVQDAAKEIGVDVEIEQLQPTEFSAFFYDPAKRADFDFVLTTGYIEVPGALYYAPEFVRPDGLFNWSRYNNPKATKLLEQAAATTDPTETAEKFVESQKIFAPDRMQVSLASVYSTVYLSDDLSGVPASIAFISSPWAAKLGGV